MTKTTVIYHANCVDGFTAAWAAWCRFGSEAEYVPAQYGEAPPDCAGKDVVIVDFSYPRSALLQLQDSASSLVVLDHHKTAQAELDGLPFCTFDMNRSGAGLAWDVLQDAPRPALIDYVEDRDLWRWRLDSSKEISAWLGSWPRDFHQWTLCKVDLEQRFGDCFSQGAAILRGLDGYVEMMHTKGRTCVIGGHAVPCINTTTAVSELVGKMATGAEFAAGWFQRDDGKFVYSLRSRGDFDVSEIAKIYGGGGHKNAAGFTVDALL